MKKAVVMTVVGDALYHDMARVSLRSILVNNPNRDFDILYFTDIPFQMNGVITRPITRTFTDELSIPFKQPNTSDWITESFANGCANKVYAVESLHGEYDQVLSLDADTITQCDLNEIFDLDIGSNRIAACRVCACSIMKRYGSTPPTEPFDIAYEVPTNDFYCATPKAPLPNGCTLGGINGGVVRIDMYKIDEFPCYTKGYEKHRGYKIVDETFYVTEFDDIFYLPEEYNYATPGHWHLYELVGHGAKIEELSRSRSAKILHYMNNAKLHHSAQFIDEHTNIDNVVQQLCTYNAYPFLMYRALERSNLTNQFNELVDKVEKLVPKLYGDLRTRYETA